MFITDVGIDLGAIHSNAAKLEQPHLAHQYQHLHEQRFDLLQQAPAESSQDVVIGTGTNRQSHQVVDRSLNLAAGVQAVGVAVDQ